MTTTLVSSIAPSRRRLARPLGEKAAEGSLIGASENKTLVAEHHLAAAKMRYEPEAPARDTPIHVVPWPMPSLRASGSYSPDLVAMGSERS